MHIMHRKIISILKGLSYVLFVLYVANFYFLRNHHLGNIFQSVLIRANPW